MTKQKIVQETLNLTLKNLTLNLTQQMIIATLSILSLSSCGTSKSNEIVTTPNTSTQYISAQKPLAYCHKSATTEMSMNISTVNDSSGQVDLNWTKVKFNFLSAQVTASGNVIRFFKWKVTGSQSSLDPIPLSTMFYNLESGQPTTDATISIPASEVATTRGVYVQLNDSAGQYQVLKAVVYDSKGALVTQMNTLIPQFNSSYNDYRLNSDGTLRAEVLLDLHPLKSTDASTWSTSNYSSYYQNFCF